MINKRIQHKDDDISKQNDLSLNDQSLDYFKPPSPFLLTAHLDNHIINMALTLLIIIIAIIITWPRLAFCRLDVAGSSRE